MHVSARLLLATGAGLGGAGVALAAVAAHAVQTPALGTAATMAILHAATGVTLALGSTLPISARTAALLRLSGWTIMLGALLFAGDVALRELAGYRLFPMAAPAGGSLMILGWLSLLLPAALFRPR